MKRNVLFIMVLTIGALFVFNTYGHCGSSDPHDEDFGLIVSVRQNTVDTMHIVGDPHEKSDVAITRKPKIVGTMYISGDPHDQEASDRAVSGVRRLAATIDISGDPHDSEKVSPVVRRPVISYISDPHEEREDSDMAVPLWSRK